MLHDANSLRASFIRIILSVPAIQVFRLFSHAVIQAYPKIKYRVTRYVYIGPKPCVQPLFGLGDGEMIKLVMHFYVICKVADYWAVTVNDHKVNDLQMLRAPRDPAL